MNLVIGQGCSPVINGVTGAKVSEGSGESVSPKDAP